MFMIRWFQIVLSASLTTNPSDLCWFRRPAQTHRATSFSDLLGTPSSTNLLQTLSLVHISLRLPSSNAKPSTNLSSGQEFASSSSDTLRLSLEFSTISPWCWRSCSRSMGGGRDALARRTPPRNPRPLLRRRCQGGNGLMDQTRISRHSRPETRVQALCERRIPHLNLDQSGQFAQNANALSHPAHFVTIYLTSLTYEGSAAVACP